MLYILLIYLIVLLPDGSPNPSSNTHTLEYKLCDGTSFYLFARGNIWHNKHLLSE